MKTYIAKRLLQLIPVILGVALVIFTLFHFVGEDPVRLALGEHATAEAIEELSAEWGLDKPLPMQFLDFLKQIVTFDFGRSYNSGEPLSRLFKEGAVVSLSLTVPPYIFGVVLFVSLGLLLAYKREQFLDRYLRFIFVGMMSVSYLVYIIVLQYLFAFKFEWFPVRGFETGLMAMWYLGLPWIIIMITNIGPDVRIYRTVFLEEITADYVRTARSNGYKESRVLFRHVLKNAMIPILTYSLVGIPYLILGAFLMERFFSIPGVGDLLINAIHTGDFPVLKGLTILISIAYTLVNLLTDIAYAYFDPRVEMS